MTELYEEWKKLKDNVESASARLYLHKNEDTESKYEEALERLCQFEKENEIPLMADEAKVKKMFCPQTNEEWRRTCSTEEFTEFLFRIAYMCSYCGDDTHSTKEKTQQCHFGKCCCQRQDWEMWLKQPHK